MKQHSSTACTSARNKNGRLERCHLRGGHSGSHTHFSAQYDGECDGPYDNVEGSLSGQITTPEASRQNRCAG
jgi:hypothetical protein